MGRRQWANGEAQEPNGKTAPRDKGKSRMWAAERGNEAAIDRG